MFILLRGSEKAATMLDGEKILRFCILRMAFMASIRKNFHFNDNDPLVGF